MKKSQFFVVAVLASMLVLGLVFTASADPEAKTYDTSIAAIETGAGESTFLGGEVLVTGFEAADGFSPGYCAQNGWTAFSASSTEGHIDTVNPASGTQHMRISGDSSIPTGTLTGCFSPLLATPVTSPTIPVSQVTVDLYIGASGGSDYDIVPQAPSQGFLNARVKFSFLGDILVLDDPGGGLAFVDTGVDWSPATWHNLIITMDPENNTIDYTVDGTSIYTGVVFAGTVLEQLVILSDNFQVDESGDFDNVNMDNVYAPVPTDVSLTSFGSESTVNYSMAAIALVSVLFVAAFVIYRRKAEQQ